METTTEHSAPTVQQNGIPGRWVIYFVIILATSIASCYRIYNVNVYDAAIREIKDSDGSPLLCANDRSRWCTIRSLGDNNTYQIDDIIADPKTGTFSFDMRKYNPFWATIDLVKHRDANGEMHFYSSKPTLLPSMLAVLYKGIKAVTGKNLEEDAFAVVRLILVLVNVIPMAVFLFLLSFILEKVSTRPFVRVSIVFVAAFATFLTPFMVTLNNHLPAAFSVGVALFALFQILSRSQASAVYYFVAGCFSAFAAANELPALSFFCFMGLILILRNSRKTIFGFIPGALVVIVPFFVTNKIAHNDWIPPYVHRSDGQVIASLDAKQFENIRQLKVTPELVTMLDEHSDQIGFQVSAKSATLHAGQMPLSKNISERFVLTQTNDSMRLAIVKNHDGKIEIRKWNNWYEYPESRWLLGKKGGVDKGEARPAIYGFHCLIGHHGIFSLTPFWVLTLCSFPLLFQSRWKSYNGFSVMVIIVSVVVVYFYLSRPLEDRNYGGGTSGLRWLLWLAPLWLVAAVPFMDRICQSIWGKIAVWLLIIASVASAHYSAMNPWVHPWLYELLVHLKWIQPFS